MNRVNFIKTAAGLALAAPFVGCGKNKRPQEKENEGFRWEQIKNPFLDLAPEISLKDPALYYHDGLFRCFYTAVEKGRDYYLDVIESRDLVHWSKPNRLLASELNFSGPGNVIWAGGRWVLCIQSYPIPPNQLFGGEDSRLWLIESENMRLWSRQIPIAPGGCEGNWTRSKRQVDPFLVMHNGMYWCFYKTSGCLGVLVSDDLLRWREALPDRPVLSKEKTPDGATVENPCIVWERGEFIMFFSRVGEGRGIGVSRSRNLIDWREIHYLDFPELEWAPGGVSAAMVLDLRDICGKWLMVFQGERYNGPAALGLAWSTDLENWQVKG